MALQLITKDEKFWPLFWTQFLGALNDNFFKNSLVMLITYKSVQLAGMDAKLLVPAAGGIFIFPFFIFSATAGQIADKYQKASVIKMTKITEFIVMIFASIGFFTNSYGILLFVLFLMGAQSAFFGPLKYGIIPSLVEKEKLVTANAFVSSGTFIAILLGTIAGGLTPVIQNANMFIAIGLLGLALIGYLTSRRVMNVEIFNSNEKVDYTFFRPTWQIVKMTMKDKKVFQTVLGISWFWFLGAAILSLLPIYCKDVLGAGPRVGTIFLSVFVVGMATGSFLTERISFGKVEIGVVPLAAVGMSLFLGDMFWVGQHWPAIDGTGSLLGVAEYFAKDNSIRAMFGLYMVSLFGGMYIVPQMTYVQEISKPSELARTIAGNNIWNALFMVSAALFIMSLSKLGVPRIMLILALINFGVSFFLYAIHSEHTVRFLGWLISHTLYRLEIKGAENVPENGSFIIASNHISFVDWLLIYAAIKRPVRFVIDYNYYYMTMGPFWFKQAKLVPIATKKESEEVLNKAFEHIHDHINEGAILGIFPEGWISRDGQMRKFQPGIHKIIKRDPIPVVLCGIDGLWGSIFSYQNGKVIFKLPKSFRKKVTMTFSKPIAPENYDSKEAETMMRSMVSHYDEIVNEEIHGIS